MKNRENQLPMASAMEKLKKIQLQLDSQKNSWLLGNYLCFSGRLFNKPVGSILLILSTFGSNAFVSITVLTFHKK